MDDLNFKSKFSSFSVNDIDAAHDFYANTLGLEVTREEMGVLSLRLSSGSEAVMVYPKPDHQAATFTVFNLMVEKLEPMVDALIAKGIVFEQYNTGEIRTDAKGISRGEEGPAAIAWFKDPAGNILAVMEG